MITTVYGTVSTDENGTEVSGTFAQVYSWASRPGATWPCSTLVLYDDVSASFDARGDLVDLTGRESGREVSTDDLAADELNAWTSDVLRDAGFAQHPAIRQ